MLVLENFNFFLLKLMIKMQRSGNRRQAVIGLLQAVKALAA
jgi:hypothetical protein